MNTTQSPHNIAHSTEIALIRVNNFNMVSLVHDKLVLLVFVELPPTFDKCDHNVLFSRIEYLNGFDPGITLTESVCSWYFI